MNNSRNKLINIIVLILGIGIAIFIISRVYPYLRGPQISSINLTKTSYQEDYVTVIEAQVIHTQELRINGTRVDLNADGELRYVLALSPGSNQISFELTDTFGNSKKEYYVIITPASEIIYPRVYTHEEEEDEEELNLTNT